MKRSHPVQLGPDLPAPPEHLGPAGVRLFSAIATEFSILDAPGVALLTVAATAADRLEAAQAAIAKDGEFLTSPMDGSMRPHPALALERVASERLLAALKALRLDVIPAQHVGRPTSSTTLKWQR